MPYQASKRPYVRKLVYGSLQKVDNANDNQHYNLDIYEAQSLKILIINREHDDGVNDAHVTQNDYNEGEYVCVWIIVHYFVNHPNFKMIKKYVILLTFFIFYFLTRVVDN